MVVNGLNIININNIIGVAGGFMTLVFGTMKDSAGIA